MLADGQISAEQAARLRAPLERSDTTPPEAAIADAEARVARQEQTVAAKADLVARDAEETEQFKARALALRAHGSLLEGLGSDDPGAQAAAREAYDKLDEGTRRVLEGLVRAGGSLGAGFAAVANEVSHPDAGERALYGLPPAIAKAIGRLGQGTGDAEIPGGAHKVADVAPGSPAQDQGFMLSRDFADAVEVNRHGAGVGRIEATSDVDRPLDAMPADRDEAIAKGWPAWAIDQGAKVRVPFEIQPENGPAFTHYEYFESLDVAAGPGAARKLGEITDETERALRKAGRLHDADWDLGPDALAGGERIGVIGAGAAGGWAAEQGSRVEGNEEVLWLGRQTDLDLRRPEHAKQKEVFDLEQQAASDDPAVARAAAEKLAQLPPDWQDRKRHLQEELDAADTPYQAFLAKRALDEHAVNEKILRARAAGDTAELDRLTFEEAPGNGKFRRNEAEGAAFHPDMQAENGGPIARRGYAPDDIEAITYDGDTDKVLVKLKGDDAPVALDHLVVAVGQDPTSPGGPAKLLAPYRGRLEPIYGEFDEALGIRPILGMQSDDGAVRVLGAAACSRPVAMLLRDGLVDPDGKVVGVQDYLDNLAFQASLNHIDSRGVVGGFSHTERMVEGANDLLRKQRAAADVIGTLPDDDLRARLITDAGLSSQVADGILAARRAGGLDSLHDLRARVEGVDLAAMTRIGLALGAEPVAAQEADAAPAQAPDAARRRAPAEDEPPEQPPEASPDRAPEQAPEPSAKPTSLVGDTPNPAVQAVLGDDLAARREDLEYRGGHHATKATLDTLDVIEKVTDPEVAKLAFALAETPSAEVQRRVQHALNSAAGDPKAAEAGLRRIADDMGVLEELGGKQVFRRANEEALGEAQARLKAGQPLGPDHEQAVLDKVVEAARGQIMASARMSMDEVLTPENLAGFCNSAQTHVGRTLDELGLVGENGPWKVQHHHTERDAQLAEASSHFFTTAKTPDGRAILLDPTFAQFLRVEAEVGGFVGDVGRRLVETDAGKEIARRLSQDGYVELTDEVADLYGKALTGTDRAFAARSFTEAEGITPNLEHANALSDDTRAQLEALPARERMHAPEPVAVDAPMKPQTAQEAVEAPTKPQAEQQAYAVDRGGKPMTVPGHYQGEFTAHLDRLAKEHQRFADLDSPDYSPRDAERVMRQRDLLEHITRMPDRALAEEVFRFAERADPAAAALLADRIKSADRFPGGSAEAHAERIRRALAEASGSEFVGTSAAVGDTYTAMGRGERDDTKVQAAAETALTVLPVPDGMQVTLAHQRAQAGADAAAATRVSIEVGEPTPFQDAAGAWHTPVASYTQLPDGSYKVIVSAGAKDHQVERAIAHELAEIQALHGRADNAGVVDALRPGSRADALSPHDQGRLAELRVLRRQLDDPPAGVSREALQAELDDLVRHLGVTDRPEDTARRALVQDALGADAAVLDAGHEAAARRRWDEAQDYLAADPGGQEALARIAAGPGEVTAKPAPTPGEFGAYDPAERTMWLATLDAQGAPRALLDVASTAIHEARHAAHYDDEVAFHAGEQAFVDSYLRHEAESFATETLLLRRVHARIRDEGEAYPGEREEFEAAYGRTKRLHDAYLNAGGDHAAGVAAIQDILAADTNYPATAAKLYQQDHHLGSVVSEGMAPEARVAMFEGDPTRAAAVLADPARRQRAEEVVALRLGTDDGQRAAAAELLDTFGGDFQAAWQTFGHGDTPAVQRVLASHRDTEAAAAVAEIRELAPDARITYHDGRVICDPDSADLLDALSGERLTKLGVAVEARGEVEEADQRDNIGTSQALGAAYDPMGRGYLDPAGVEVDAAAAMARLPMPEGLAMRLTPLEPGNAGLTAEEGLVPAGTTAITVVVGTPKNGAVASYEQQPDGSFLVVLSAGAAPHHVERALAHELAEIAHLKALGVADNRDLPDALAPGSKAEALSPDDRGRAAELGVIVRQLADPPPGVTREELLEELREASTHLGLVGEGAEARRALLATALGADSPVFAALDAHATVAPDRRAALTTELAAPDADPAMRLERLRALTPAERLIAAAEHDAAREEADGAPSFRAAVLRGLSPEDRAQAEWLLDEARQPARVRALPDPEREAAIGASVDALHRSLNRMADGASGEDAIAALSTLRDPREVQRFLALAQDRFGPRYSEGAIDKLLADRLGDADFAVARAWLRDGPVLGSALHLAKIAGEPVVSDLGSEGREALGGRSDVRVIGALLDHRGALTRSARGVLKLDQPDQIVDVLARMHPDDRRQLVGSPLFAAIRPDLERAMPERGALRHTFEALLLPDDTARHAGLLAARMHQAFDGSGKRLDQGHLLATDRAGLGAMLDMLKGRPELFEATVVAYQAQAEKDAGVWVEGYDHVASAIEQLESDVSRRSHKLAERDVLDPFRSGPTAAAHERAVLETQLAQAKLAHTHRDVFDALGEPAPGRAWTAAGLRDLVRAAQVEGGPAADMSAVLDQLGVDVWKVATLATELEALERKEKAHRVAAAVRAGRTGEAIGLVDDPALRDQRAALAAELNDPAVHKADRELARQRLAALDTDRALLAAEICKVSAGRITPEDLGYNEGGEQKRNAPDGQLTVDKSKWLARAFHGGGLEDHEKLFIAIRGAGTDVPAIRKVFAEKSPDEARAIVARFKETFGDQAFLSLGGMLRRPLRALRGGGQEDLDAEAFARAAIDGERLDKRVAAELHLLMAGDPKALFDPSKPPSDPDVAREAATARIAAELDALDARHGVERERGLAQGYLDWEERTQERLGLAQATGKGFDDAVARVHDFVHANRDALSVKRDPAAWKELERLKAHAEAQRASHVQFRGDAAKSLSRGADRVALLVGAPLGHFGAGDAKKVVGLANAVAKVGIADRIAGRDGQRVEQILGVALKFAVGELHAPAVNRALAPLLADLPEGAQKEVLAALKAGGLHRVTNALGQAAVTAPLSGDLHRDERRGVGDVLTDKASEQLRGMVWDQAQAAALGTGPAARTEKKEGPTPDPTSTEAWATVGGKAATGLVVGKEDAAQGAPKDAFTGLLAEATGPRKALPGAGRVATEQSVAAKREMLALVADPESGFDPRDRDTVKALITAFRFTPAELRRCGVHTGLMLSVVTELGKAEHEAQQRAALRQQLPDPEHDAREVRATDRLLDEAQGFLASMDLVASLQQTAGVDPDLDAKLEAQLLAHTGVPLPEPSDPTYARRRAALSAVVGHTRDQLKGRTDKASDTPLQHDPVVETLTAYRQYERNEVAMRSASDPIDIQKIREENAALVSRLKSAGVDVTQGAPPSQFTAVSEARVVAARTDGMKDVQRTPDGVRGKVGDEKVRIAVDSRESDGGAVVGHGAGGTTIDTDAATTADELSAALDQIAEEQAQAQEAARARPMPRRQTE